MLSPIELLKETELLLFNLCPADALALKAKTINLLKDLPLPEYLELRHQISQERKVKENFLAWLKYIICYCEECQEN